MECLPAKEFTHEQQAIYARVSSIDNDSNNKMPEKKLHKKRAETTNFTGTQLSVSSATG